MKRQVGEAVASVFSGCSLLTRLPPTWPPPFVYTSFSAFLRYPPVPPPAFDQGNNLQNLTFTGFIGSHILFATKCQKSSKQPFL